MYKITLQTLAYCISVVLITLQLTGSSGGSPSQPEGPDPKVIEAQTLIDSGQLSAAAKIYRDLSEISPSPEKEHYQLLSVELLIESSNITQAQEQLDAINDNYLNTEQLARKQISQAKIYNLNERFNETLSILPESIINYVPEYKVPVLELRAQALAGNGETLSSILTRITLGEALTDPEAINRNHNEIWQLLDQANREDISSWSDIDNHEFAGWIALSRIIKTPYTNKDQLANALDQWKYNYSNHPASEEFINNIADSHQNIFIIPDKIALLLPMSGKFAKIPRLF